MAKSSDDNNLEPDEIVSGATRYDSVSSSEDSKNILDDDEINTFLDNELGEVDNDRDGEPLVLSEEQAKNLELLDNDSDDPYFEEDKILAGDDEVIYSDDADTILQQLDGVLSFRINNLYKEDSGAVRNQYALRYDPPVFEISDNKDNRVEFKITREMATQLEKAFGDVRKAYYGVDPTVGSLKTQSVNAYQWFLNHKIISAVIAIIILVLIFAPMVIHGL